MATVSNSKVRFGSYAAGRQKSQQVQIGNMLDLSEQPVSAKSRHIHTVLILAWESERIDGLNPYIMLKVIHMPCGQSYGNMMIKYIGVIAAATALAFVSTDAQCQTSGPDVAGTATRENDAKQTQILNAGVGLLKEKRPAEAIQNYFDKVIASYEATYPPNTKATYCARSAPESLFYLMQSAKDNKNSVVIGPAWCDAYFLRAYGLIDLGRDVEARQSLEKAISMSPKNAHYVSELASLYRREKDWKEALAKYESAAQLARDFSPPESNPALWVETEYNFMCPYGVFAQLDDAGIAHAFCSL